MAIAIDVADLGGATSTAGGTSFSFNTGSTVASGGFIVVGGWWFADDTLTVAMSGGGLTWATAGYSRIAGGGANDLWVASAQAPSGLASGTTITATFTGGTSPAYAMGSSSFTGVKTSSPLDGTVLSQEQSATSSWATPSYTIQNGSVLIGISGTDGTGSGSTTVAPSIEAWDRADVGNGFGAVMGYRIESSAGSYTVGGTWAASVNSATLGVAYLAAAAGGPGGLPLNVTKPNFIYLRKNR